MGRISGGQQPRAEPTPKARKKATRAMQQGVSAVEGGAGGFQMQGS